MTFRIIKPSISIKVFFFVGFGVGAFFIPTFLPSVDEPGPLFIFGIICLCCSSPLLINCFIKRLTISESGIEYKSVITHYKISWDEIKIIGIGYIEGRGTGLTQWIYINSGSTSYPPLSVDRINPKLFIIQYRHRIIDEILRYWPKEILGLSSETNYIDRCQKKY